MELLLLNTFFIAGVSERFGKHVYVNEYYLWPNAQQYCRDHYTDLSPITTRREEMRLKNITAGKIQRFWIGLHRDGTDWKWSGGGNAKYTAWDEDEPDDNLFQKYVSVCWHDCGWKGWHNDNLLTELPFLCLNLMVIDDKKTWEGAMLHCKRKKTKLTSLASDTDHILAVGTIQQDHISERVWIGLRYLNDGWLWVNSDPLNYRAWAPGGDQDHQCPIWKRCGALTKGGLWENRDCSERLNFICA